MTKVPVKIKRFLFGALLGWLLVVSSCDTRPEAPPFPYADDGQEAPVLESIAFTGTDTLTWETQPLTAMDRWPSTKFEWDKLRRDSFDIEVPYAVEMDFPEQPFSLEELPHSPFYLDSLPQFDLDVTVKNLGAPTKIEVGELGFLPGATRGVTVVDNDFGFPSLPRTLMIDHNGMIWMANTNGIARYDSQILEFYGVEQGIQITTAFDIFEDSKNRIWILGAAESITILDIEAQLIYELRTDFVFGNAYSVREFEDGSFWVSAHDKGYAILDLEEKSVKFFGPEEGLRNTFTIDPYQDKDGLVWLNTFAGLHVLDLENHKNYVLSTDTGLLANEVVTFEEDQEGRLWIVTVQGWSMLNATREGLTNIPTKELFKGGSGLTDILIDDAGVIWSGTDNGMIFALDPVAETVQKYGITNTPNNILYDLVKDPYGQVWGAGGSNLVFKIDLTTGRPGNYDSSDGLGSDANWSTLFSSDGLMWIGSYEGIDVFDPQKQIIYHLNTEEGLINERSSRLLEDRQGRIWSCGNTMGVSVIDPKTQTVYRLSQEQGLVTDRIWTMVEDNQGRIWLGGDRGEYMVCDFDAGTLKTYRPDNPLINSLYNFLFKDAGDRLWMATVGDGIQIIDPKTSLVKFLGEGTVQEQVVSFDSDSQGRIWAATLNGLQRIDLNTMEVLTFRTAQGLPANEIFTIGVQEDKVYAGTLNGLAILSESGSNKEGNTWQVTTLGKSEGLAHTDFNEGSIGFDGDGRMWGGADGVMLTVIDPITTDSTELETLITGINILDSKVNFKDAGRISKKRDSLFNNWLTDVDRSKFADVESAEASSAENISWSGAEGPYNLPKQLELPYTQNYLSFSYNGNVLRDSDKTVYRYILEGIDKSWSKITPRTTSENYRDLPPGKYTFKVASKGFSGSWGEPAAFSFSILPPWWKTWWACLIFAVLIAAFIWWIMDYRSRWLKRENRLLEERVAHRTAQLKNKIEELKATQSQLIQSEKMASLGELTAGIAHEIQNPLNFVNNFSEVNVELIDEMQEEIKKGDFEEAAAISKDIKSNQLKIQHHGKRADSIVKGMLQHSRSSNGIKEPTNINSLCDEYLRLAYHGLRAKDKSFNATLETHFEENLPHIEVIPQDVGRAILNLITNAFHACADKKAKIPAGIVSEENYQPLVKISTASRGNYVDIAITDNADGIAPEVREKIFQPFFTTKPSGRGTGLGLSLSYDIVHAHGGKIELDTKIGEGTTFTIRLPK